MVTQDDLKRYFNYNAKTGVVINKITRGNSKKGERSGAIDNRGYLTVSINSKMMQIHRLAFLYEKGYLPKYIDHIDGDKLNNKIDNLRECRQQENCYNRKMSKNNQCGVKGVYWDRGSRSWRAQLSINGKNTYLGCFWEKELAAQVVSIYRLKHHGEFANNG